MKSIYQDSNNSSEAKPTRKVSLYKANTSVEARMRNKKTTKVQSEDRLLNCESLPSLNRCAEGLRSIQSHIRLHPDLSSVEPVSVQK